MSRTSAMKDKLSKLIVDHTLGIFFGNFYKKGEPCPRAAAFSSIAPVLFSNNRNKATRRQTKEKQFEGRERVMASLLHVACDDAIVLFNNSGKRDKTKETRPHTEPGRGVGVVYLDLVCFCV